VLSDCSIGPDRLTGSSPLSRNDTPRSSFSAVLAPGAGVHNLDFEFSVWNEILLLRVCLQCHPHRRHLANLYFPTSCGVYRRFSPRECS
jgi:hypothetical protein